MGLAAIVVGAVVLLNLLWIGYLYFKSSRASEGGQAYELQGFLPHKSFLFGYLDLVSPKYRDPLINLRELSCSLPKDCPGFVSTQILQETAILIITDSKIAAEIRLTESSFSVRALPDKVPWETTFGFLNKTDNSTTLAREFYLRFFSQEAALKSFTSIEKVVSKASSLLVKSASKYPVGDDLKFAFDHMIALIFQNLVFGQYSASVAIFDNKLPVCDALLHAANTALSDRGIVSTSNLLTGGLACKFGAVSGINQAANIYQDAERILTVLLEKMKSEGDNDFSMAAQYIELVAENKGKDLDLDNFPAFLMDIVVLGILPLAATLNNLILVLSSDRELQKEVRSEIVIRGEKLLNMKPEDLDSMVVLDAFIKKYTRQLSASQLGWERLVFKQQRVGNITLYPGHRYLLPVLIPQEGESSNDRQCPNQAFSDTLLKLVLVHLLIRCSLEGTEGATVSAVFNSVPVYQVKELKVQVVPLIA